MQSTSHSAAGSKDKNGLNRYHTLRGTNDAEGSIHKQICWNFSALNASPILADCVMADWHHQYNTEIGSLNQEGKRYMAHHNPWLDHLKSVLCEGILWKQQPKLKQTFSEIDPLSFQQTHEQFGILWVPDTLRIKYNFDGQAVEDPRTVSQNALNLSSVYPMRLHLSN